MKSTLFSLSLAVLASTLSLAALSGCKTDQVGVTNTLGTYSTIVSATPDKATKAAQRSLEQMKFLQIVGNYTKVDGRVTAKTAQNDDVTVNVEEAGDTSSKVSVRVGSTGGAAVSAQILDKIKDDLR